MTTYKSKTDFIIASVIFIVILSFASISNATSENSEGNGPSVMQKDKDGKVSQKEFMQHHKWMFEQNDINQDGYLDADEMKDLHKMAKEMHKRYEQQY